MTAILIFDVETTGLCKDHDQIIELAVQAGMGPGADRRTWRFLPSVPLDPAAQRVHGIGLDELVGQPPFAAQAEHLHRLFDGAEVLVGYNIAFDLDMLQAEFVRAGLAPLGVESKLIIDPYKLWQKMEPRGLLHAHRRFAGGGFDGAHRAGADVAATAAVLAGMIAAFGLETEWPALAALCKGRRP